MKQKKKCRLCEREAGAEAKGGEADAARALAHIVFF